MNGLQKFIVILGRIFLSFIFILAAINQIVDWSGAEESLVNALNQSLTFYNDIDWIKELIQLCLTWSSILMLIAVIFEIVGGLLVFFGIRPRFGAFLLLLFLIPTTFFFHGFWTLQGADRNLQMTIFLKNLSIFGGLLLLLTMDGHHKHSEASEHETKI